MGRGEGGEWGEEPRLCGRGAANESSSAGRVIRIGCACSQGGCAYRKIRRGEVIDVDVGRTEHEPVTARPDVGGRNGDRAWQVALNIERELLDIGALGVAIEDLTSNAQARRVAIRGAGGLH